MKKQVAKKLLNNWNEIILIFLLLATIAVLALQVIMRTFSSALPWAEEVSRYLFVYMVFGGAALALKKGAFISVDILSNILPKRFHLFTDALAYLLTSFFLLLVIIQGIKFFVISQWQYTPALGIEIRYIYLAIPIFGVQMFYYSLDKTYKAVKKMIKGGKT